MKLNFNENRVDTVETVEKVSMFTLMKRVLQMININSDLLANSDIDVLAFVMCRDKFEMVFQGEGRLEMQRMTGLPNNTITKAKTRLIEKGFLMNDEDIDSLKGNGILTPKWRGFAELIKQNKIFELSFKFEVE